jgi:predicted GIY-YIG superfamily endonuclease
MFFVYFIESLSSKNKKYIGFTSNLDQRLKTHNSGGSKYTVKDRPWKLVMSLSFESEEKALLFEKYLKTGSGRAFAKKRFW